MLFCSALPGRWWYGNSSQITLDHFPKYLQNILNTGSLWIMMLTRVILLLSVLTNGGLLCSFAIKDCLDLILVFCKHFSIGCNPALKRFVFPLRLTSLFFHRQGNTMQADQLRHLQSVCLTFQGSIYRVAWTVVHPFISSKLTLTVALQRDTEATSTGCQIKVTIMRPDSFWEIKFPNATKRSFLWQPVSWQGYRRWDEPYSQFPYNKVGVCALNFLINTPDFSPHPLISTCYSSLIAFSTGLPFCCSCPIWNTLLYNFIAVHFISISVVLRMTQQRKNDSRCCLQLLVLLCFFSFYSRFVICCVQRCRLLIIQRRDPFIVFLCHSFCFLCHS